jgi:uncharacterized membrane protein SirB2
MYCLKKCRIIWFKSTMVSFVRSKGKWRKLELHMTRTTKLQTKFMNAPTATWITYKLYSVLFYYAMGLLK